MKVISTKVSVEEVTLTLGEKDFQKMGEWQSALASATKENAYGLAKDLAGDLELLLSFLTGIQVDKIASIDKIASTWVVSNEKTQNKPTRSGKRQPNKTTKRDKVKVTVQNIDDNNVFQSVVRLLGRFVKCGDCMSIESQLRQDKGTIYIDNEQELDELLNVLMAYNLTDNKVPIIIAVE